MEKQKVQHILISCLLAFNALSLIPRKVWVSLTPKDIKEFYLDILKRLKVYRIYNSRTSLVEEVIHVIFNDHKPD